MSLDQTHSSTGPPAWRKLSESEQQELERIVRDFERAWRQSPRPELSRFLPSQQLLRLVVLGELVRIDFEFRCEMGDDPRPETYISQFAELASDVGLVRSLLLARDRLTGTNSKIGESDIVSIDSTILGDNRPDPEPSGLAPSCLPERAIPGAGGPEGASRAEDRDEVPQTPSERIGRYRVERILGRGGFGIVFLAHDEQLNRPVAVKVAHAKLVSRPAYVKLYLDEARTAANLDHPHIVPVHDVGSTEKYPFYIVSKYVDGVDLASRLVRARPSMKEAVELVATVADALHYAHKQGVVHRDVKPGNILIDAAGKPYVVDFGLALRDEDLDESSRYAGTPAYMSPEQARGEGHRVDGRSDVFSLGVVLYELLAGRRPFRTARSADLFEEIISAEPRPPRQIDDRIPSELERICLKALAKRATERYTTAKDLASDLRQFLDETPGLETTAPSAADEGQAARVIHPTPADLPTPAPDSLPVRIIPKGLRSFDEHDADFFLELLPGPRDREGLPDTIRFWKTRIEEGGGRDTFPVGLIYGPSGCGKSSLVKAGLLPRLSENIVSVYVECTAGETEVRLLNGLRKRCPLLPENASLQESLGALRRGQHAAAGKVLIVLDQFEQWLHAPAEQPAGGLVRALRQCDGAHVQCLLMVRDDFWMTSTRFMRDLEVPLAEGVNSAAVDLFDVEHAQRVLSAFGKAFGKLPDESSSMTREQKEFVRQAVAGLAENGKIISVRLALLAEMMKGRPWTPSMLKEVGGTHGVGVAFLEDTFSSATAPPKHRFHQTAARAVLQALLPESGADIKGHMRSYAELLAVSGYAKRPRDFDDLMVMLDGEIRLITPTDPEGAPTSDDPPQFAAGEKFYQLTHDHLVHSLRDWLTLKQRETKRGRARLRLAERAALWSAKPEPRQLPTLIETANILLRTRRREWTPAENRMLRAAKRRHVRQCGLWLSLLVALAWSGYEWNARRQVQALVRQLATAGPQQVSTIVATLRPWSRRAVPLLREGLDAAQSSHDYKRQVNFSLALLPFDPEQLAFLKQRALVADPEELLVLRNTVLYAYHDLLKDWLWEATNSSDNGEFFHASCMLAQYDFADGPRWNKISDRAAELLVTDQAREIDRWLLLLEPASQFFVFPLLDTAGRSSLPASQRALAIHALDRLVGHQAALITEVLLTGDKRLCDVLPARVELHREAIEAQLRTELARHPAAGQSQNLFYETWALRHGGPEGVRFNSRINAAGALIRLGREPEVRDFLKDCTDQELRREIERQLEKSGS